MLTRRSNKKSRLGCVQCKLRRKKCNELKPKCSACLQRGQPCSYESRYYWYDKDQKVFNGCLSPVKYKYLINFNYTILKLLDHIKHNPNEKLATFKCETTLHKKLIVYPTPGNIKEVIEMDIESNLFDHYVKVISEKKVFSNNQLNEFKSIIIPHSYISSSLFKTIIAISASDLIRKFPAQGGYYSTITNKYKNDAINSMYNMLDNPDQDNINEIIICILLLCSLEIGERSNYWINYLKEACIIFQSLDEDIIINNATLLFCYRYFSFRYILLLTTLNKFELDIILNNFRLPIIAAIFNNLIIDYMFGCPPKLIKLIYEITTLKNSDIKENNKILNIFDQLNDINSSKIDIQDEDIKLKLCSQCYLSSVKLYYLNSFGDLLIDFNINIDYDNLISSLFQNFEQLLKFKDLTLFPSWTLFMLSVNKIDNLLIINLLLKLEKNWPFSSITLIKDAIEIIWKIINLDDSVNWRDILNVCGFKLALT